MKTQVEIENVLKEKKDDLEKAESILNKVEEDLWVFPQYKLAYEHVQKIKGEIKALEWVVS